MRYGRQVASPHKKGDKMVSGIVKNIEENAVHDGSGIRALGFMKGCIMHCRWCQNPELIRPDPEIWYNKVLCKECGKCVEACPLGILTLDVNNKFAGHKDECNLCGECLKVCDPGALSLVGEEITSDEWVKHFMRYSLYFNHGKGGVTLSGGDPIYQPEFSAEVLRQLQEKGVHTTIESALHYPYADVLKVLSHCDTLIADIKHMNSEKHKWGTGVGNKLILENFKKLDRDFEGEIHIHIPLVPGFNDDDENIRRTADFACMLDKVVGIDLLPFNTLPVAKFEALGVDWEYKGVEMQSKERLKELFEIVTSSCGKFSCTTIGGLW